MQEWARRFGFGARGGHRHRPRGGRPRADAGLAQADVHERLGQGVEPGRLDPARDRPEGRRRDAAPDGPLLRDDRQRRQARDPVRRRRRSRPPRCAARSRVIERRFTPDPPRVRRRRPGCAAGGPRRALLRHALDLRHLVRRLLELPDRRSRARRARRRRSSRCRATRRATSRTSPGGAATGRPTTASDA